MSTYYFGVMEFGHFVKSGDSYPMAIIRRIDLIKEFKTREEAIEFYENSEYDDCIGTDAIDDEFGEPYEIVFKTREA